MKNGLRVCRHYSLRLHERIMEVGSVDIFLRSWPNAYILGCQDKVSNYTLVTDYNL